MSSRDKRAREELARFVADLGPEDGVPPKFLNQTGRRDRGGRAALRLARAAERCLGLALQDARGSAVLRDLLVARVVPAAEAAHLRVLLVPADPAQVPAEAAVRAALAEAGGWLRAEVAAAVRRRRVPELVFAYLPGSAP